MKLRIPTIGRALFLITLVYSSFSVKGESFPSGAFIINMGITPQTTANGLKPYGMLYDLITNYNVPVKWIINSSKAQDGVDFTYNAVQYKGGTFVIKSAWITAAVASRITYWQSQGVQGVYTTSTMTLDIYATLTSFPMLVLDNTTSSVITPYFTNAGIPTSSFRLADANGINACDDLYALPHADPTWATHSFLYDFVTQDTGWLWSSCHAVSVMESLRNPSLPTQQLNFLSTQGLQCYSSNKCSPITMTHAGSPTSPMSYPPGYGADPIMQFMGYMHDATDNGSEKWYIPATNIGSQWRSTTKRLVITANGTSPAEGIVLAYGPGYGNTNNGWVMYEAGHRHTTGNATEQVAAQRAFFNFCLLAGINDALVASSTMPGQVVFGYGANFSVSMSSGTPPYTYQWSTTCAGTFTAPTSASTYFNPDSVSVPTDCIVTVTVTDACNRNTFQSNTVTVMPPGFVLPVQMVSFSAMTDNEISVLDWTTSMEQMNDRFEIERMQEGEKSFSKIGEVPGSGTTQSPRQYQFIDDVSSLPAGLVYYRLRQVDYDDNASYTSTQKVQIERANSNDFTVFPNPSNSNVTVSWSGSAMENVEITIYNITGQVLYNHRFTIKAGDSKSVTIDVSELPAGLAMIVVRGDAEVFERTLMITE